MRFKKLKDEYYIKLKSKDEEVLYNDNGKRPYIILVNLIYKGKKQTFAVPLRSNISSSVPTHTHFVLPRRHTTKDGNLHDLHYIKLVLAHKKLLENVQMRDNSRLYLDIINRNMNQIESELQSIIDNYENGIKEDFCINLDKLFEVYEEKLDKIKSFDKLKISLKKEIMKSKPLYIDDLKNINPVSYIEIKNGNFFNYEIEDTDLKAHKKLIIKAINEYKQVKSISIDIIVKNETEQRFETVK